MTYLVQIAIPQSLHEIVSLLLAQTPLVGNDCAENVVDLPCHVCGITADIDVGTLLDELVDLLCVLGQPVLNVDLLVAVAGESVDHGESITELVAVCL